MKLAIISRAFLNDSISGRETVIYHLWKLAKETYDTTLICGWKNNPKLLPRDAYKLNLSGRNKYLNYLRLYVNTKKLLYKIRPDIILSNSIEVPFSDFPSIVIVHDFNFGRVNEFKIADRVKMKLISYKLKRFNKIIAVSNITRNEILKLGISSKKIVTIHSGIDTNIFVPEDRISNGRFKIVYPARILYGKGQHIAIEAIRKLSSEVRKNVTLQIVGYVEEWVYFKKIKVMSEGLPIEVITNVEDIVPYYQQADIIIFPTIMSEGFGYTAIEGMSCAKAVIYSDFPVIKEATGGIGISVPKEDPLALARAIEKLYHNKDLMVKLGAMGRKYVEANYSWNISFRKYQEVFDSIRSKYF